MRKSAKHLARQSATDYLSVIRWSSTRRRPMELEFLPFNFLLAFQAVVEEVLEFKLEQVSNSFV